MQDVETGTGPRPQCIEELGDLLVGLAYTVKPLWAPVLDRWSVPLLGRRRGWILLLQALLAGGLAWMAYHGPERGLLPFAARIRQTMRAAVVPSRVSSRWACHQ